MTCSIVYFSLQRELQWPFAALDVRNFEQWSTLTKVLNANDPNGIRYSLILTVVVRLRLVSAVLNYF